MPPTKGYVLKTWSLACGSMGRQWTTFKRWDAAGILPVGHGGPPWPLPLLFSPLLSLPWHNASPQAPRAIVPLNTDWNLPDWETNWFSFYIPSTCRINRALTTQLGSGWKLTQCLWDSTVSPGNKGPTSQRLTAMKTPAFFEGQFYNFFRSSAISHHSWPCPQGNLIPNSFPTPLINNSSKQRKDKNMPLSSRSTELQRELQKSPCGSRFGTEPAFGFSVRYVSASNSSCWNDDDCPCLNSWDDGPRYGFL